MSVHLHKNEIETLLNNLPGMLYRCKYDHDWTMEFVSDGCKELTGYNKEELLFNKEITYASIMHKDDSSYIYDAVTIALNSKKPFSYEYRIYTKDGQEKWVWEQGIGIYAENGDLLHLEGFITDITSQKAQSNKLKNELKQKDKIMIAQSRQAAMGEMISMIAHQWRQPLSVIAMGINTILMDIELGMIEEKSVKTTSLSILNQTQELSKTIDNFRDFFKPENIVEKVSIADIIKDCLGIVETSIVDSNIDIIKDLGQERKIKTYSRELIQVLINILNNAKEALIENREKDRKIILLIEYKDENFFINISDNAGGIDEKIIDEVFTPYFSTKNEQNDTGLGLYMSKAIVEKHLNGKLSVKNMDQGACFELKLPREISKD